jgi:hypothetical protein
VRFVDETCHLAAGNPLQQSSPSTCQSKSARAPSPSLRLPCSYERWRHWLAPALRVSLISGPGAWKITTLALQGPQPWGAAGGGLEQLAGALAVVLFASAVATNCTMGLARSVNLPANAPTQVKT